MGHRVFAAVVALGLAGCSSSSSGGGDAPGSGGVRGTELASFSCKADPNGRALRVAPAQVTEIRVCALTAPEPFNRPPHAVSTVRGSAGFEAFVNALALPDAPRDKSRACPAYAELLPTVIARTATTALLVHLPSDACGHSLPDVRARLDAAINSTAAGPANGTM